MRVVERDIPGPWQKAKHQRDVTGAGGSAAATVAVAAVVAADAVAVVGAEYAAVYW